MQGTNRNGDGVEKILLCDPGSELRLGERERKTGEDNKWDEEKKGYYFMQCRYADMYYTAFSIHKHPWSAYATYACTWYERTLQAVAVDPPILPRSSRKSKMVSVACCWQPSIATEHAAAQRTVLRILTGHWQQDGYMIKWSNYCWKFFSRLPKHGYRLL